MFIAIFVLFIIFIVVAVFLMSNDAVISGLVVFIIGGAVCASALYMYPEIVIKIRESEGRAQLAQATANRRIQVEEATAHRDSAALLAEAEVLRAKGVSEANKIVAQGLGGPEGYLRYLYIEGLKQAKDQGSQIIYVPTEAGLPILEAGRLK